MALVVHETHEQYAFNPKSVCVHFLKYQIFCGLSVVLAPKCWPFPTNFVSSALWMKKSIFAAFKSLQELHLLNAQRSTCSNKHKKKQLNKIDGWSRDGSTKKYTNKGSRLGIIRYMLHPKDRQFSWRYFLSYSWMGNVSLYVS